RDALVPGQLHEGLGIGDADQLRGLRAVADIALVAVGVEVRGRAVDQLEATLGDRFPVIRRNALADDAPRDRDELVVDVLDVEFFDLGADLLDQLFPAFRFDMCLEVSHRNSPAYYGRLAAASPSRQAA